MSEQNTPRFCLKENNVSVNGTCPLCGARTDPSVGLYIFLDGTWREPCPECAEEHAPELWHVVQWWQEQRAPVYFG